MKLIDLTGYRFGRLTVIERVENDKPYGSKWRCKCDCGKETVVLSNNLRRGKQVSCGCWKDERAVITNTVHGLSKLSIYNTWKWMIDRCENPQNNGYKNYGGRGIKICDEWHDLLTFYNWGVRNGWENGLTIERINVNGNYEPDNCTWIPLSEQAKNTRKVKKEGES